MPTIGILAGGLATRLRPISTTMPKSMVEVAGEPFIGHQLRMLAHEGFENVVLLCGHLGEQIEQYVGNGRRYGVNVRYSYDGPALKGTGGAIRKALPLLGARFMTIYGDSWCPTRYRPIWEFFVNSGKLGLMTVFENDNQWDKSNVDFNNGIVVRYDKREATSTMRFIDYGVGGFTSSTFEAWNEDAAFDLATVQLDLVRNGQLAGFEVRERFYEIGSPAGLRETDAMLRGAYGASTGGDESR